MLSLGYAHGILSHGARALSDSTPCVGVAEATPQPETETERLLINGLINGLMTERILNPLRILSQRVLEPLSVVVPRRAGRRRREHVLRRPV